MGMSCMHCRYIHVQYMYTVRVHIAGALTKGDRRAASGTDLNEFNFDTPYGRQALRNMYASICQKHIANGVTLHSVTKDKLDFAQFNDCMQVFWIVHTLLFMKCG